MAVAKAGCGLYRGEEAGRVSCDYLYKQQVSLRVTDDVEDNDRGGLCLPTVSSSSQFSPILGSTI